MGRRRDADRGVVIASPDGDGARRGAIGLEQLARRMISEPSLTEPQSHGLGRIALEAAATSVTEHEQDYTAFFRAEFTPVLRTVTLMLRDRSRAEEITQDAFVQLLHNWAKVSHYDRPQAWVRRVAIRLAVRAIRRDRLWAVARLEFAPPAAPVPSPLDVPSALRRLSGAQRAAIVLHYYEDRPVTEIAAILGCAEATARVHLHRGRNRLRQLLGEGEDVT